MVTIATDGDAPAFPTLPNVITPGITFREYLLATIIQGLVSRASNAQNPEDNALELAQKAILYADTLIDELEAQAP